MRAIESFGSFGSKNGSIDAIVRKAFFGQSKQLRAVALGAVFWRYPKLPYKAANLLKKPACKPDGYKLDKAYNVSFGIGADISLVARIRVHFFKKPVPIPDFYAQFGKVLPETPLKSGISKIGYQCIRMKAHVKASACLFGESYAAVPLRLRHSSALYADSGIAEYSEM